MRSASDSRVTRARRWFGSRVARLWGRAPDESTSDDHKALLGDESAVSKKARGPAGPFKVGFNKV